jgi:hypothetical protein
MPKPLLERHWSRTRQYASASDLGADIRCYLEDQPITARPPGSSDQLQKFARRHKAPVADIAAVLVLLTGEIVASTIAERSAIQERDAASEARRTATADRNRAVDAEKHAMEDRNRAVAEQRRADTESATAKAVNDFLQNDLLAPASSNNHQAAPAAKPGPGLKVRTALDRAARSASRESSTGNRRWRLPLGDHRADVYGYGQDPEAHERLERALELYRLS